ncbi:MAG: hypothetical protein ACOCZL_02115 [Bacteroidota bacterium]
MKLLVRNLPIFLVLIFLFGCQRDRKPEIINVKQIEYRVEYIDDLAGSIPTNILPGKMILIFHEDKALTTIEGFLGQFSLSYLADLKQQKVTTMLKLFDKNYYYEGKKGELPAGIVSFEDMKIEETSDSAMILDFMCRKYIIQSVELGNKEIWSTTEIDVKNPNITTHYREIPGVLLQFYSQMSVLKMFLLIEKYQEKTIPGELMEVPDNYNRISKAAMEKTLVELFK